MKRPVLLLTSAFVGCLAFLAGSGASSLFGNIFQTETVAEATANASGMPELVSVEIVGSGEPPRSLAIAKYEVTYAEWEECVSAGACKHQPRMRPYSKPNHPVSGVSWLDVQHYLAWLSSKTGRTFRLPRASEWKAVAADILDDEVEKLFDDPRLAWAADYANFGKRAERATKPAGHFGESPSGVADLAGNVWEWTDTCWRSANSSVAAEATGNCGGVRVLAGAHMTYQSELIRVVPTGGCSIGFPPANIGFRVVLDEPSELRFVSRTGQNVQFEDSL